MLDYKHKMHAISHLILSVWQTGVICFAFLIWKISDLSKVLTVSTSDKIPTIYLLLMCSVKPT